MPVQENYDADFRRYLNALLEGDARVGHELVDGLLASKVSLATIYGDYIRRGMYEVGVLWERNQISVAIEHLAASTTQLIVSELFFKLKCSPENGRQVIIACVPHEMHDVGSLIVANVFQHAGWKIQLLGANTPAADMVEFIAARKPDMLALSCTLPANRHGMEEALARTVAAFPQLEILIGGQALGGSDEATRYRARLMAGYPTVRYIETLEALEHHLSQ
jgi:MerR family transcriptional regulator, light-induced transcriptional regulator